VLFRSVFSNEMNGKDGRKRPPYSPDQTLDKMTTEADNRQRDTLAVQKEARAIRASELEKQRRQVMKTNFSIYFLSIIKIPR